MSEMDWTSVITCIWLIQSSSQSHIQNKTLVWMCAEESDIVVVSFQLLRDGYSMHLLVVFQQGVVS